MWWNNIITTDEDVRYHQTDGGNVGGTGGGVDAGKAERKWSHWAERSAGTAGPRLLQCCVGYKLCINNINME